MEHLNNGHKLNGMKIKMASGNMMELVSSGVQSSINYLAIIV